jgi:O-antigen/teichoic acid export membrane protein
LPKLSIYGEKNNKKEAIKLWHSIIFSTSLLTIPSVIFFIIMAKPVIVILFSKNYVDGVWPYRILLLMLLVQMTGYGLLTRAFSSTKIYIKANIVLLISGVVLTTLFTKFFGISGASAGAVIAFTLHAGIILLHEKKLMGLRVKNLFPYKDMMKITVIASIASIPVVIINSLALHHITNLAISLVVFSNILLVVYHKCKLVTIDIAQIRLFLRSLA